VQGFLYSRPIPSSEIEKVEAEARPSSNILKLRRKA
jgi:EAL domain-containing protein (putative c-di-GMP-specific phosphodiesterase class I)